LHSTQHTGGLHHANYPSGLLCSSASFNQSCVGPQDVNGILEGRLLDEFGKPTVGVNVIVESPNLQGVRATTTGEDGYFRLLALPIGAYSLHVRHVAVRQDARYLGSWRAVQI